MNVLNFTVPCEKLDPLFFLNNLLNIQHRIPKRLTFRIGPTLFKYIELIYEKIKKYKKEKERKKERKKSIKDNTIEINKKWGTNSKSAPDFENMRVVHVVKSYARK